MIFFGNKKEKRSITTPDVWKIIKRIKNGRELSDREDSATLRGENLAQAGGVFRV